MTSKHSLINQKIMSLQQSSLTIRDTRGYQNIYIVFKPGLDRAVVQPRFKHSY